MSQTDSDASHPRRKPIGLCIPCTKQGCNRWFKNRSGYTQHTNAKHPVFPTSSQPSRPFSPSPGLPDTMDLGDAGAMDFGDDGIMDNNDPAQQTAEFFGPGGWLYRNYHPFLSAQPCDLEGNFLPPGTSPPPLTDKAPDDWTPYRSWVEFELADYLFTKNQTPAHSIDHILNIWAASLIHAGSKSTIFSDHRSVYKAIDNTPLGDVKWESFTVKYTGDIPEEGAAPWMADSHEVWFRDPREVIRNMLANPDFAAEMDLRPYCEFATENDEHQWKDFMSGDWAYKQADIISEDTDTHGSTFVPVILGSDKTTVSVATGQNDYYPLYASIGNVQNNVRRAHRNAVAVVGFFAMPKTTKQHAETKEFQRFHRQLFHSSLSYILKSLKPGMTTPEVAHFGDGHYRCVIYGLGPYIADYEEQVLLACIVRKWCAKCLSHSKALDEINIFRSRRHVDALIEECDFDTLWAEYGVIAVLVLFTNDFPHADIHKLLAPDLLHQIIKGSFKDHLVEWVERYLLQEHGKTRANIILDDIDRRIAAVPPFPGLRQFPQGRHFKQWTGDDSKALMKVYLPAIEGHVPEDVVRAFSAFLKFCYLKSLKEIQDALTRFHQYREIFKTTGTVMTFSLPRQHSMVHYVHCIRLFGAPNGLCSSIMESKHIKAVKEPWRQSSRYNALGQMLLTNQRLDKLTASRVDFRTRGMLAGTCLSSVLAALGTCYFLLLVQTEGKKRAQTIPALANELAIPHLADLVRDFLVEQLYPEMRAAEIPESIMDCPRYEGRIRVFNSAVSMFFAPSNLSGIGGMKREHIRVSPNWRNGHTRKDCVFVITDPNIHGMRGMDVAWVLTFFSFRLRGGFYPCAVVQWFNQVGNAPDDETGLWMVEPSSINGHAHFAVIHVESIFWSAHLIPVYGIEPLPMAIKSHHALDIFTLFYVNRYADHHAFEIVC
ncbi:hypothetical protein DFJ58DRAFT_716121 [Suillus subalutaceus]|uniref:uncharacterized protein n=1 Tax=Suillus subalutaceus TaxID=48586 RepID=UPI001B8680A2|nr:uncharacterized protein DFJ58DRAFT_716121 [Suillus subalutaceus]KAG1856020.1 hypothetical protein DFJ58DRAFT_716121 [Suillus subalutaceus]